MTTPRSAPSYGKRSWKSNAASSAANRCLTSTGARRSRLYVVDSAITVFVEGKEHSVRDEALDNTQAWFGAFCELLA